MTRVLVTGSTDGIGRETAHTLSAGGHDVVAHARSARRAAEAGLTGDVAVGDLADLAGVHELSDQLQQLAPVDAVIHNAGVIDGPTLLAVNVVAPYVMTARMLTPRRWIALSSSMHRSGEPRLDDLDWTSSFGSSYSDSKLLIAMLGAAVARRMPETLANVVDPGWVRSRMGGASAPVSLAQGAATQSWLAVSGDTAAAQSGRYWLDRRQQDPHPAVHDEALQEALLASLAEHTGLELPA